MDILKSLNVMGVIGDKSKLREIKRNISKYENEYATIIQKHIRGYLIRKTFKSDLDLIHKICPPKNKKFNEISIYEGNVLDFGNDSFELHNIINNKTLINELNNVNNNDKKNNKY